MKSLRQALLAEPSRFNFDAAVGLLRHAAGQAAGQSTGAEPVRFHAQGGLALAASDVLAVEVEGARFALTTGIMGLTGPGGVLPRPYTELVNAEQRRRSPALAAMLDLVAQRTMAQFAAAGAKYRPHRSAALLDDQANGAHEAGLSGVLLALTGYALPGLAERLPTGPDPLLFYAGAFAARPRSAERLAAILTDWLGQPIEVEQFAGSWTRIDREQMTALPRSDRPGQHHRLGVDAAAGAQAWDIQSRVVLRVGPLGLPTFKSLRPGQPLLRRLCALAAAYLDGAAAFSINPVLAAGAVPQPQLTATTPSHLGWDTWLPVACGRSRDAADALFAGRSDAGVQA